MYISPEQLAKSGTEHGHQCAIFAWAAQNYDKYPQLRLMFAIPNGGYRNAATAGRLKAEGVKSGVADIFLPYPKKYVHGLFIELKVGTNKPTKEQHEFISDMERFGYTAMWVIGWESARDEIIRYIENKFN